MWVCVKGCMGVHVNVCVCVFLCVGAYECVSVLELLLVYVRVFVCQ